MRRSPQKVPTWAKKQSKMAEHCLLSRYPIYVQMLCCFLCQVGPNMGPSWVAKSLQKSLKINLDAKKPPRGPQRPLEAHLGSSGGGFWTLQGSIWDLPGGDFLCNFRSSGERFCFTRFPAAIAFTACLLTWLPAATATLASQIPWVDGCSR